MTEKPEHSPKPNPNTVVLIGKCKEGDEDARNDLVARFYGTVWRMVKARMGPVLARKEGVEDLVHDTFMSALKSLDTYEVRPDAHFTAFLYKVVRRTVANRADYYQAAKRNADLEVPIDQMKKSMEDSEAGVDLARDSAGPRTKAGAQEMKDIVDSCVSRLSEDQREVILLRDYAGADWDFIAGEQGRTVGAVQQLHQRARARLSEAVKALG